MKNVAKYNIFKGVSTLLTIGTPIVTLLCNGEFFVKRSDSAVSAAAMLAILLGVLFFKDKIVENFKMPAPAIICGACLGLIYILENILYPMKLVLWITLFTTATDLVTFRRLYKRIEIQLPENVNNYKHFGFIFTTSNKLETEVMSNDERRTS